jgi:hypothetical protein
VTLPGPAELFGLIVFGLVGSAALLYGKRTQQWKRMVVGGALIVFPYFTSATWQLYAVGIALCVAFVLWRD